MPNNRVNKTIAGYHLLMLLSAVDQRFHQEEDQVIRDYLLQEFPFQVNLDREIEIISGLSQQDWESHFEKCIDDFQDDSTPAERVNLLRFAIHLTKADDIITQSENHYLQKLFEAWDYSRE